MYVIGTLYMVCRHSRRLHDKTRWNRVFSFLSTLSLTAQANSELLACIASCAHTSYHRTTNTCPALAPVAQFSHRDNSARYRTYSDPTLLLSTRSPLYMIMNKEGQTRETKKTYAQSCPLKPISCQRSFRLASRGRYLARAMALTTVRWKNKSSRT